MNKIDSLNEMIKVNRRQAEYYNLQKKKKEKQGILTRFWWRIREKSLASYLKEYQITKSIFDQQKDWFGDISRSNVLDFGCGSGNIFSLYLAKGANRYLAFDLSASSIENVQKKLIKEGIFDGDKVNAVAGDILVDHPLLTKFDIIYAAGVLHHFQDLEVLLKRLSLLLNDDGIIVTYDPTKTVWYVKLVRSIYRPFQDDSEWEFPFDSAQFNLIEQYFNVEGRTGILGKSLIGFIINLLPIPKSIKIKRIRKAVNEDIELSKRNSREVYRCLHVSMLLKKK